MKQHTEITGCEPYKIVYHFLLKRIDRLGSLQKNMDLNRARRLEMCVPLPFIRSY